MLLFHLINLKGKKPVRPDCYRHFVPRFKTSTPDQVDISFCNERVHLPSMLVWHPIFNPFFD